MLTIPSSGNSICFFLMNNLSFPNFSSISTMKSIYFIIFCSIIFSSQAYAQIASPSMDPSQKTDLAAASSWRFYSSIALGYRSGSGKIKSNSSTIAEFDQTYTEALLAAQLWDLTFEYSVNPEFKRTSEINSTKETLITQTEQSQFNLAYRITQNISIGASSRKWEFDDNSDPSTSGSKNETGNGQENASGLGISVSLLDLFFFAYGVDDVKHKADGYKDNEWQDQYQGVSIFTDGGLRIEWSQIESPESEKTGAVSHNQYTDTRISVEYLVGEWLLSYQSQDYVVRPIGSGDDVEYEYVTYGLGMIADQGISVNLSMKNGSDSEDEFEVKIYRLAVAYNY